MASWQQVIVVGNLGRDPEIRYLPSGQPVCNFTMAVTERWSDRQTNEQKEKTVWFRISVYGPQAETCKNYLAKGRQAMVIGTIEEPRIYTNNAGEPATSLDIRARDVRFLGSREDGGGSRGGEDYSGGSGSGSGGVDDIPF